ncbi:MAG: hypothetical protein ABIJ38_01030, partial [Patescibacteria group bacterium]
MNPAKSLFLFLVSSSIFLISHISPVLALEPIWSVNIGRNTSSRIYSLELDSAGSLYIPKEGGLVKVSSEGVKEWEYEIPNKWIRLLMGSPAIAGDAVVLISGNSGAYAYFIDRETGELIKEQELVKIGLEGNPYY